MADSEANYVKVPVDGADSQRGTNYKVGIALIGLMGVGLLGVMAISTSGPSNTSVAESTSLFGLPTSLRAAPPVSPMMSMANIPGPSPWKEIALAAIEGSNGCHRDISVNANPKLQNVLASLDSSSKALVAKASGAIVKRAKDMEAGQTGPMGFFDPLGLSTKVSGGKLLYYREAEVKHGRVCMFASIGYVYGELFHPFFGGKIDYESYKVALPEYYHEVGMDTFWFVLFVACAIPEVLWSAPTLKGFGEMKEDRIPGDFGWDPLDLKNSGYVGTSFVDMQNKELNNGRLAMLAWAGMVGQELATGKTLFPNLIYN